VTKVIIILWVVLLVIALLAVTIAWLVLTDAANEEQKQRDLSNRD
jgi:sensor domain CHASE-containing protein